MTDDKAWRMGATVGGVPLGITNNGRLPVFQVHHLDAFRFANWIGGRLPTKKEWNIAAGSEIENPPTAGPFQNPSDGRELDVAINRANVGPMSVGQSVHDVSVYGIRDMTGNGAEFTCTGIDTNSFDLAAAPYDKGIPPQTEDLNFVTRGNHYLSEDLWNFTEASRDGPTWNGFQNYITFRVIMEL